jgi:hypothetical protein
MTNALSYHDATIQAELVCRGEMSPLEGELPCHVGPG